ncbi:Tim44/TimA family putative adaptor protein [Cognatishimia activa]|uniref:Mitochondrial import inner membrane, translocase subunit n=1 Tax=Cognatishimia activa TaxID=1715691 RepID=A0A0P1ILR1_9RHOB|nr:Tim44/TimA family putative adaptor protein [Cognatishimia activa]MEE2946358.1 Tim44/TimA family putative adaptor protein [Pseudomonadota bacterium]CUI41081.1 mitochondrial import inner membrane, translocase subunit [Cognatishimia activa]CUK24567.1 mitochondrial import inner membrane, translocase subunit [Cognatishimia activa]
MNSPLIQLLVLAGIAVFLILRLRNVLGTRDGFEPPREAAPAPQRRGPDLEVIEGGPDRDITDHAEEGSDTAVALGKMKSVEPGFGVSDFIGGAKGAYEMILMGFEKGDLAQVKDFLAEDVYDAFAEVIQAREAQGLTIDAEFIGVRETALQEATFDDATREAEVTVKFIGELTYVVRNADGEIVEGSETQVKRQKDAWTFARVMGSDDPNWQLVATGE